MGQKEKDGQVTHYLWQGNSKVLRICLKNGK